MFILSIFKYRNKWNFQCSYSLLGRLRAPRDYVAMFRVIFSVAGVSDL